MEWNVLVQFASLDKRAHRLGLVRHERNDAGATSADGWRTRRRSWSERILFTWINVIAFAIQCGSMLVIIIIVAARAHYNI